jgi:hypothetical protein
VVNLVNAALTARSSIAFLDTIIDALQMERIRQDLLVPRPLLSTMKEMEAAVTTTMNKLRSVPIACLQRATVQEFAFKMLSLASRLSSTSWDATDQDSLEEGILMRSLLLLS